LWGSLGLIPIFMFWVYMMWLAVLFGLEVAATLQMIRGRNVEELEERRRPHEGLVDPACVVPIMKVIASHFAAGRPASPQAIVEATGLCDSTVSLLLERLALAGLIHRLADGAVTLARPPDQISAEQLIEIGFQAVGPGAGPGGPASVLLESLRSAQRTVAAKVTLGQLG
jgi:membrane protein